MYTRTYHTGKNENTEFVIEKLLDVGNTKWTITKSQRP